MGDPGIGYPSGACLVTRSHSPCQPWPWRWRSSFPRSAWPADGKPDFTGTWTFAQQKSDYLPGQDRGCRGARLHASATRSPSRSEPGSGDGSRGSGRTREKRILTIEHTPKEFKSGGRRRGQHLLLRARFDESRARGAATSRSRSPGRATRSSPRRSRRRGRVVIPRRVHPPARRPVSRPWWRWRLEHDSMKQPLEVRLAFDRAPQ